MRKNFLVILMLPVLILAACGAASSTPTDPNGNSGNTAAPLPLAMKLVVGTFKLEETDNAITAGQAAQLIPLWQVYKDLSISSTAAQEEVTALAEQIQGTLTPQQVEAITAMNLSRRDVFQTMQDLGIASANRPSASGTPRANTGQGGGGNFQGGGGDRGPGGSQGFSGQNLSPQQIATFQAQRSQNGGGNGGQSNRIQPALFDALISLLQGKK